MTAAKSATSRVATGNAYCVCTLTLADAGQCRVCRRGGNRLARQVPNRRSSVRALPRSCPASVRSLSCFESATFSHRPSHRSAVGCRGRPSHLSGLSAGLGGRQAMPDPAWPVACSSPSRRPVVVKELQRRRSKGHECGKEALVGVVRWGRSHDGSSALLLSSSPAAPRGSIGQPDNIGPSSCK